MDGVLVIDKPQGWTSHDIVAKIRNLTKIKKVGHTGTLDPFATGVLPLTLGHATRLTNYFISSDKTYHGVMRFGFATDTYDCEGEASGEDSRPHLDAARVEEIFSRYRGAVRQTQPPYSAKKIHGKPMYEYARKGVIVEAGAKDVTIHSLKLLRVEGSEAEFELTCTAGTYARSLAHDVGRDYGCGAHLARLRRTRSGDFPVEASTGLGEGDEFHSREYFLDRVIPMRDLLQEIPAIRLSPGDRERAAHGMDLNLLTSCWDAEEYRLLDENGNLVAMARRLQTFVSPVEQPVRWVRIHPHINFFTQ
ncbi:MAG: tRNA pseudouridine synthase [Acidobacteria bacterium]|jgi:tRNA pseudouridine55 synthase|nr:tRNA pseudouridine synthase [Acidobacteriota bacterium]